MGTEDMQNYKIKCKKCKQVFSFNYNDIYWDEKGYGYSTKLVKCKECNCPVVVQYYYDESLDINNDTRFYSY